MEKCCNQLGNYLTEERRKRSLDNIPDLPEQIEYPDFTRLRDIPQNTQLLSGILQNAIGGINGSVLPHPYNSLNVAFLSDDLLWSALPNTATTYKLIGPPGETFNGQLTIFKPQLIIT